MTDSALPDDQQETEEEFASPEASANFSAVVTSTDWTTQTILSQLSKGNIELNPNFQRRDAWKANRKSQFIESLILGVPVPQIVLAERKEKRGSYIVIDGKQRLLALKQFAGNGANETDSPDGFRSFRLTGLELRKDLNGADFLALQTNPLLDEYLSSFENQTIRTVVIRNWPNEDFLYLVFLRLNTGSVALSPQELRQALHPGPFSSFVDKYSIESTLVRKILRISQPDFRMRDAELVIRYFAFRNFIKTYNGNLKPLLDNATKQLNSSWRTRRNEIETQVTEFESAMQATLDIFGDIGAFRKWNGDKYESSLNRAVFDVMVLYFVDQEVSDLARQNSADVVTAFKTLCENDTEFRASIEGTTKSIESINTRMSKWAAALTQVIGLNDKMRHLEQRYHIV